MPLDDSFYAPAIGTLADAQAMAIEQVNAILARVLDLGVIVDDLMASPPADPVTFRTDADSASGIWETFVALETGGLSDTWWKSAEDLWYEMQPSATDDFAGQAACCVVQYRAAANDNAKALRDAIDACASINAVLELDLGSGWPSRTCADVTLPTFGAGSNNPRVVFHWYHAGTVTDDQIIFTYTLTSAATLFDPEYSYAWCEVAPAADIVFDIVRSGYATSPTSVGSVTFAAGETWATVSITENVAWMWQTISLVAPSGADGTIAGIAITFDWASLGRAPPPI